MIKGKHVSIVLITMLVFSTVFIPFFTNQEPVSAAWWTDTTWDYCKKVTVDCTKVDATLTNFPILVQITSDSDLATNAQADGDDILFSLDGNNETKLNHEIESWVDDGTYVNASIWVNVTSLSSSADTAIWMYYGNATCASQENVVGTWNSGFIAVYHMKDNTTSTISDSTSVHNGTKTAANQPIEATGKIGKCQNFDGNNDKVSVADNAALDGMDAITISAWIKPDFGGSDDWYRIVDKQYNSAFAFFVHSKTAYGAVPGDLGCGLVTTGTGGGASNFYTGNFDLTCTENVWSYATMVWSATSAKADIYLNKTTGVQQSRDGDNIATNAVDLIIGNSPTVDRAFYGLMDEIRISNVVRNTSWINASYNTQNMTTDFLTFGSEQTANTAPTVDYKTPINGTTGVAISGGVTCYAYTNDTDGDTLNITWATNESGIWVNKYTNTSEPANGTESYTYTDFDTYSTKYYWKVYVNDGTVNISEIYHFTTADFIWIDITNATWDLGNIVMSSSTWTNETGKTFIADKDNCSVATDLKLQITNDGADWTAATSGNAPGTNTYRINASTDSWVTQFQIVTASATTISTNIAFNQNETFDLRFDAPTSTTVSTQQSVTVTATIAKS